MRVALGPEDVERLGALMVAGWPTVRFRRDDGLAVMRVMPGDARVIVERVNMIKRHTRPNPSKNIAGGISEKEAAIHISNVMLVDPDRNTRTRIARRRDSEGNPERVAKKSGAVLA